MMPASEPVTPTDQGRERFGGGAPNSCSFEVHARDESGLEAITTLDFKLIVPETS
jgi:hypothetical protein